MAFQDILQYFRIIRKWWWVIVLLVVATVGTMLIIALLTETEYEATAIVQVSAPPPQEAPLYSQFGREALSEEIAQTRSSFNEFLLASDVAVRTLEALPEINMNVNSLRESVTVELPDDSQLMYIRVRATDSETAALLANTYVDAGLQRYGDLEAQPTANTRRFIEQEFEGARLELAEAEQELAQFQIDNRIGTLKNAIDHQYDLMRALENSVDLARIEGNTVRAEAIEDVILERETELQNLIGLSAQYNSLVDHTERVRATYNFLLDKRTEARIKENQILKTSFIQVITPARAPQKPLPSIDGRLILLGAIGSILVGTLLAFFLEYLEMSGAFKTIQNRPSNTITAPDSAR